MTEEINEVAPDDQLELRNAFKKELATLDLTKYSIGTMTAVFYDIAIISSINMGLAKEVLLENLGRAYDHYLKALNDKP